MALSKPQSMLMIDEQSVVEHTIGRYRGELLSMFRFVEANNLDINMDLLNGTYHGLVHKIPIYICRVMSGRYGFSGNVRRQIERILDVLNRDLAQFKNIGWWYLSNDEYKQLLNGEYDGLSLSPVSSGDKHRTPDATSSSTGTSSDEIKELESIIASRDRRNADNEKVDTLAIFPPAPTGRGVTNTKHLLMTLDMYQISLLSANTEQGLSTRYEFHAIVKLTALYNMYRKAYDDWMTSTADSSVRSLVTKMSNQLTMMDDRIAKLLGHAEGAVVERDEAKADRARVEAKLDETKAVVVETQATLNRVAQQRVVSDGMKNNEESFIYIFRNRNDDEPTEYPYYVCRRQVGTWVRKQYELEDVHGVGNITLVATIGEGGSCPNPVKTWNGFRRVFATELNRRDRSGWYGLVNWTEAELVRALTAYESERVK